MSNFEEADKKRVRVTEGGHRGVWERPAIQVFQSGCGGFFQHVTAEEEGPTELDMARF